MPKHLLHGTSKHRAEQIFADGLIKRPESGPAKVALTPDKQVAWYWARLSAEADKTEGRGDGTGVVLVIKTDGLELETFSDPVWGEGGCDWEQEQAVWYDVPATRITEVWEGSERPVNGEQ